MVIEIAVFIDARWFRAKRETWVDDVLAADKAGPTAPGANVAAGNNVEGGTGTITPDGDSSRAEELSGTKEDDSASEDGPATGPNTRPLKDVDAENTEAVDPSVPGVAAQARQAPSMRERLMNYLAANGSDVAREEIHWLIAEWGAGPAVVVLSAARSWQRASMAPLLAYLDQDADGGLSAAEIAESQQSLKRADGNGDDVVEVAELRRLTNRPPVSPRSTGHSLVVPPRGESDGHLW
jgi:hypothetical protein